MSSTEYHTGRLVHVRRLPGEATKDYVRRAAEMVNEKFNNWDSFDEEIEEYGFDGAVNVNFDHVVTAEGQLFVIKDHKYSNDGSFVASSAWHLPGGGIGFSTEFNGGTSLHEMVEEMLKALTVQPVPPAVTALKFITEKLFVDETPSGKLQVKLIGGDLGGLRQALRALRGDEAAFSPARVTMLDYRRAWGISEDVDLNGVAAAQVWRTRTELVDIKKMDTARLAGTICQIWNHVCPDGYQSNRVSEFKFPEDYTKEYLFVMFDLMMSEVQQRGDLEYPFDQEIAWIERSRKEWALNVKKARP